MSEKTPYYIHNTEEASGRDFLFGPDGIIGEVLRTPLCRQRAEAFVRHANIGHAVEDPANSVAAPFTRFTVPAEVAETIAPLGESKVADALGGKLSEMTITVPEVSCPQPVRTVVEPQCRGPVSRKVDEFSCPECGFPAPCECPRV